MQIPSSLMSLRRRDDRAESIRRNTTSCRALLTTTGGVAIGELMMLVSSRPRSHAFFLPTSAVRGWPRSYWVAFFHSGSGRSSEPRGPVRGARLRHHRKRDSGSAAGRVAAGEHLVMGAYRRPGRGRRRAGACAERPADGLGRARHRVARRTVRRAAQTVTYGTDQTALSGTGRVCRWERRSAHTAERGRPGKSHPS